MPASDRLFPIFFPIFRNFQNKGNIRKKPTTRMLHMRKKKAVEIRQIHSIRVLTTLYSWKGTKPITGNSPSPNVELIRRRRERPNPFSSTYILWWAPGRVTLEQRYESRCHFRRQQLNLFDKNDGPGALSQHRRGIRHSSGTETQNGK